MRLNARSHAAHIKALRRHLMLHCGLWRVDVRPCEYWCSLLLLSRGAVRGNLSGDMRWMLRLTRLLLTRLLPRLLDPGVLERMLLDHSRLLWGSDLPWAWWAHLDTGGTSHGHSWSLLRMSSVLLRMDLPCRAVDGEALVLEMGRRRHVMSGGSSLSSHCRTLMCGMLLLNCLRLQGRLVLLLGGNHCCCRSLVLG